MFALVDCNNFFVSCELVFRPDLRDKPVVVLSNNDGCVISRSDEAKAIGIPMGAPVFEYKKLFEKHNVQYFSANFTLYGDMSRRVMTLLAEFCQDIEIYSIDEAFLDFSKTLLKKSYKELGLEIKQYIYRCTGIPISIGFAKTKVLAKLANRIAKKFPLQTEGVHIIDTDEKYQKALNWIPVEDIWGIGRRNSKKLYNLGVHTGSDFIKLPDVWIKKNMTILGLRIKKELKGESCLKIEDIKEKKSISIGRTFERELTDAESIKERISAFVSKAAEKLRSQHSVCGMLLVYMHSNLYKKDHIPFYKQQLVTLPYKTSSTIELVKYAKLAVDAIYKKGYPVKKAGVILLDLMPDRYLDLNLFEQRIESHDKLMKVVDKINKKMGDWTVHLASHEKSLKIKTLHNFMSPKYTTRWEDILKVNCKEKQ